MIRRAVFERVAFPWFDFEYRGDRGSFETAVEWGEDIYFCEKAVEAGFEVWCRLDCIVQHAGEHLYDVRDAWECKAQAEETANADTPGHS